MSGEGPKYRQEDEDAYKNVGMTPTINGAPRSLDSLAAELRHLSLEEERTAVGTTATSMSQKYGAWPVREWPRWVAGYLDSAPWRRPAPAQDRCVMGGPVSPALHCRRPALPGEMGCKRHHFGGAQEGDRE